MADEGDRCFGKGDYAGECDSFSDDPLPLAVVRPLYHSLYRHLSMGDVVQLSADGTQALKLGRDGFTYGETTLSSVYSIMNAVSLPSYACSCAEGLARKAGSTGNEGWLWCDPMMRCTRCGHRPAGAFIVDLGSGIGNVVLGATLLSASGALSGPIGRFDGVELLPTLHKAGQKALDDLQGFAHGLHEELGCASSHNNVSKLCSQLHHVLPHVALHCGNLEAHDLSDCDIVYMASTVFDEALLARFAQRAAEQLRRGCRVVTLAEPLSHPSFRTEAVVPCTNSWGEEDAFVNVRI